MLSLVFLLYFICAATFTLAKATLLYAQPIFYVGVRMVVAGTLLLGLSCWQKSIKKIVPNARPLFIQIIFFNIYFAYVLDLWSLHYLTSIESSVVFNLSPFAAALFSYFWFAEVMTPKKWLGLFLGFISLVPMLFVRADDFISFDTYRILPIILLLCSVFSSAYGWIVMRALIKDYDYSPFFINGIGMLGGGILALATSATLESWSPSPVFDWPQFALCTVAMIVLANGLFSNLYSYLLKFYTATFISFAGFSCPLFTMLLGWFFLGEPLSGRFFYALIGVCCGLLLFYQEELRQGYEA